MDALQGRALWKWMIWGTPILGNPTWMMGNPAPLGFHTCSISLSNSQLQPKTCRLGFHPNLVQDGEVVGFGHYDLHGNCAYCKYIYIYIY